jgi:hypothetical protein
VRSSLRLPRAPHIRDVDEHAARREHPRHLAHHAAHLLGKLRIELPDIALLAQHSIHCACPENKDSRGPSDIPLSMTAWKEPEASCGMLRASATSPAAQEL